MLKYIEIDSTYRDRKKNPNPAEFEIVLSQSGTQNNLLTAVDPIATAAPRITYKPRNFATYLNSNNGIPGTPYPTLPPVLIQSLTLSSFIAKFSVGWGLNKTSNYYRGCGLTAIYSSSLTTLSTNVTDAIIISWAYVSSDGIYDYFRINLDKSLDTTVGPTSSGVGLLTFQINFPTDFTNGFVFIPTGETASSTYKNWYVYNETRNEYSKILTYDGTFALATMESKPSWNFDTVIGTTYTTADTISIRKELPITYGTTVAGSTLNTVNLDPTSSSSISDFYKGFFIRFTSGTNKNSIIGIYSYSGAPNYTATLLTTLSTAPSTGTTYEILPFTKDNYTPFTYVGSAIAQESCYEIQLINLIVPNITLEAGGTIASYPYFYIEFYNQSTTGGSVLNTSYSNNPNSTRKLFKVPVSDFSTAIDDAFLTLDKSNSLQTIRMNPYGSFKFGVYLPDGVVFNGLIKDTVSPFPPNPFLQISAVFAIRRVI